MSHALSLETAARYTEPREKIVGCEPLTLDDSDFYIWAIMNPVLAEEDRVFLEIVTKTARNVLVGGNPLYINVLGGTGSLHTVDLKNGNSNRMDLNASTNVFIPTDNILYWFKNTGEENLWLRDTSPGFKSVYEPLALNAVTALTNVFPNMLRV